MSNFKILVVEDEVLIAIDIQETLQDLGYDVCQVCYHSEDAIKALQRHQPDLVLLDISIPGNEDGIALAHKINEHYEIPFIYLTSHADLATIERAKHTKPYGYIVKPFKDKDLISSIEIALYNYSEDLKKKNIDKSIVDRVSLTPFSDQEYAIFLDVVNGMNNRQIGEAKFLSVNTIKTYLKRIFEKLEVHDRVSAVRKVIHQ